MGRFGRLVGGGDKPPEWASFFPSGEVYRAFCDAVVAELARRGQTARIGDGEVVVKGDGPARTLGLQNLAQVCNGMELADWPAAIQAHFDSGVRSERETAELEQRARDFERVRDIVKARLYPPGYLRLANDGIIHRALADDIVEVLTFDLPSAIMTVGAEHVAQWSRPIDDLFELGRHNVLAEGKLSAESIPVEDGVRLTALMGDSFYSASHALLLPEYLGHCKPHGALVAVPTRHMVLCHAIENAGVMAAVNAMLGMAHQFAQEGPGSISSSLYWWRAGRFERLPAQVDEKSISFMPPDEFADLLSQLASTN